ncbi:MarR family winged helix-turn-helix transcriptional regulator [Actinomadura madurae]|uniref:MarR family winged helix-turn-helix transcriptional regulator n=1 Tax=Actinomadura madurae TaxID=1993 RepID=UPI0020D25405|nr:MarR family transcriptional regulator [Actinomadura madurae]MCP9955536.1 MarR family transcriptional regulator [Actinomadura madurae]MCP9972275.1 MarR family transcriptional regulator [Actinomadura madurae]MCP9984781.1 MarR family transcriptional regulator [Actinomadura madurae]MCQ0003664.1 MarR family transcriptional regulator [Actinomadura madurae]
MNGNSSSRRLRLALLLRLLHREYTAGIEAALGEGGFGDIRPGDAKVFPFVPPEGIQIRDLAARAGVRKQTMAQSVDQLERGGYLERRPNPRDGRSRLIVLTERGRAVRPLTAGAGDRIEERWAELTSPEEFETLRALLHRLLDRIAEADPDAAERLTSVSDDRLD